MARTTGRCARKKNGAPAPLHTLQGLRALARIESPGGPSFFFVFFGGTEKKEKILNPLYPFSQKKVCKPCSTLFTTPLVPRVTSPPFTSPFDRGVHAPPPHQPHPHALQSLPQPKKRSLLPDAAS